MSDLVERYVHQVGRYLPQKERSEIQEELRSQIHDQLEDRFGDKATQDDVAEVLKELGDPKSMAVSYAGEQYLIGPTLYPIMMMVLQRGWVIVPFVVVIVHVLLALLSSGADNLIGLIIEATIGVVQATLIFTGIVVLLFAIVQHSGEDLEEFTGGEKEFDPLALPEVDEPGRVDRFEAAFGIAFGAFMTIIMLYYLRVGGLTLKFNLNDPGEVIPVPIPWLILLILNTIALIIINLMALQRGRWTIGTKLLETLLEAAGAVFLTFATFQPLLDAALVAIPALANIPFVERLPVIFAVTVAVITLVNGANALAKLWANRHDAPSYHVKSGS